MDIQQYETAKVVKATFESYFNKPATINVYAKAIGDSRVIGVDVGDIRYFITTQAIQADSEIEALDSKGCITNRIDQALDTIKFYDEALLLSLLEKKAVLIDRKEQDFLLDGVDRSEYSLTANYVDIA